MQTQRLGSASITRLVYRGTFSAAVVGCLVAAGCADAAEDGRGTVTIRASGEGAAKQGYPFIKNGAEIAFVDGWSMRFSKYLASFGQLRLADAEDRLAFESPAVFVVDLHSGDPEIATFTTLPARRWDRFSFRVVPPPPDVVKVGNVADEDVDRMRRDGFNYWIEGTATKSGVSFSFAWGLRNAVRATNCTSGIDGTDGLVVRKNTTSQAEITFHIDHLFWDTLGTEKSKLRFDAIAAASGADNAISWDELGTQSLSDLRGRDGKPLLDSDGTPLVYNPGSIPLDAQTLQAFMLTTAAGQVHLDGTGLCTVSRM